MSAEVNVAPGDAFDVVNATSVRIGDILYQDVTAITYPDGTVKTCADILGAAGGAALSLDELKKCVKVEGYSPDDENRQVFSIYSSNSRQTSKNEDGSVPGGMWIEMFDFTGGANAQGRYDNPVLQIWADAGHIGSISPDWLGFKMNYGSTGTRAYKITQVNDFVEESQPTPAVTIDCTFMHSVSLTGLFRPLAPKPEGHFYVPIRFLKLYRTLVTSDGSAVFRQVPTDPRSTDPNPIAGAFPHVAGDWTKVYGFEFADDVPDSDLSDIELASTDWDQPPWGACTGLTSGWNGMMFAYWENAIIPFEPYRPHAAPAKYRIALPHRINRLIQDGNTLIALTVGPAYLITGAHPSQLQHEVLPNTQSSKASDPPVFNIPIASRAAVRTPFGVIYATEEGLAQISGSGSPNVTEKHFTKIEWEERYGPVFGRLRLAYSNEKVVAFFKDTGIFGVMLSLQNGRMSDLNPLPFLNAFSLPGSDGLYVLMFADNGSTISKFEGPGTVRTGMRWTSKEYIFAKPVNMGCFSVVGNGAIQVTASADDRVRAIENVVLQNESIIVNLPTGFRCRKWQFTLAIGAGSVVKEFYAAETRSELQRV